MVYVWSQIQQCCFKWNINWGVVVLRLSIAIESRVVARRLFKEHYAVRPSHDFRAAILEHQPQIVHFSGHGALSEGVSPDFGLPHQPQIVHFCGHGAGYAIFWVDLYLRFIRPTVKALKKAEVRSSEGSYVSLPLKGRDLIKFALLCFPTYLKAGAIKPFGRARRSIPLLPFLLFPPSAICPLPSAFLPVNWLLQVVQLSI